MRRFSSRPADYTALPSFRRIVALGPPVVPVVRAQLERHACSTDFFLAYAVLEIRGWPPASVKPSPFSSEQDLCRGVLKRLAAE